MKLVELENIHLTLRFLGEISPQMVREVATILDKVEFRPFSMRIEGLGTFPEGSRRPRVVWLGVSHGAEEMKRIYEQIEKELRRLGFPKERERFVPHITIARVKWANAELLRVLHELREVIIGDMVVDSIRLKKSTLTRSGPIYETLHEVKARAV